MAKLSQELDYQYYKIMHYHNLIFHHCFQTSHLEKTRQKEISSQRKVNAMLHFLKGYYYEY
jgi:hypothetical protein